MKKLILALLLVSVLLSVSAVHADPSDKPILFRGLEWGTPYSDVLEEHKEYIIKFSRPDYWNTCTVHYAVYAEEGGNGVYDSRTGFMARVSEPDLGQVAGYDLEEAGMFFAMVPDENGLLTEDMNSARLYMGYYAVTFRKMELKEAAWEDLTQKLTLLYGDCDLETSSDATAYRVWYGADGTMVSLKTGSGSGYIYIWYSFEGGETLLQEAQAAIDREFSLNTEGL